MNIQTEKLALIDWITQLKDKSMIDRLLEIKEDYSKSKDWWDSLGENELESIQRGIQDIDDGKIYSQEAAQKLYGKHL